MAEIALLFPLGGDPAINSVVIRQVIRGVTLETDSKVLLPGLMLAIQGHSGSCAFRGHKQKDENGSNKEEKYYSLDLFTHLTSREQG
jgi:hypothetical protein